MVEKVKSQNLSIMMTDLQGYTDTSNKCSREEIISLIRKYNQLLAPIIEFYGGKVIKTIGDAFLATFQSATDAVITAIIIQLVLREYNLQQQEEYLKMNTRVVVHSGDVSIEKDDIYGDAVNITARIEGLSCFPGGSIGISETTYLLMDRNEVKADKIGPQQLKGIPDPVTVYLVPMEKQKLKEIPANLSELLKKVLAGDVGSLSQMQIKEWTNSVQSFLKEKNWGDDLGKFKDDLGKNIGKNIDQVQKKLVKTFSQGSVVEKTRSQSLSDACIPSRVKSFAIDSIILILISIVFRIGWWGFALVIFGSSGMGSIGEFILGLNFKFPIVFYFMYFALFWKLRGASPGQIVSKTGVLTDKGEPIDWSTAFLRSALMIFSTLLIFGPLMALGKEKQTFYDMVCNTKVVE